MLGNDPHQPGPVVHGVAKTRPKRQSRRTLILDDPIFACSVKGSSCLDHNQHEEIGRVLRKGQLDVVYRITWHYEDPITIRTPGYGLIKDGVVRD